LTLYASGFSAPTTQTASNKPNQPFDSRTPWTFFLYSNHNMLS
jgi:hypothetical protein